MAPRVSKRPAGILPCNPELGRPPKKRPATAGGGADYSEHYPPTGAKALVFDCDGTLVDTMPAHFQAWMLTAAKYGLDFNREKLARFAGRAEQDIMAELFDEAGLQHSKIDAALGHKKKVYQDIIRKHPPRPIPPVLAIVCEGVRRGLPMAVVSGSCHEDVVAALEYAEVLEHFSVILGREDYCNGKPDPEPYLLAAAQLGLPPRFCVGYEDAEVAGIASIKAAGYMKAEMVKSFADYPTF
mmetsp:Transcript_22715/g.63126  ORF Transcript_22715/g.63126 Transcript_22715/m.63126 type:complete len:241 (-) Transcript_22715:68-790(-)|eukprot:CAMPEP_0179100458 /NCGR_PEP_ID=MMETSP0796-20121207/46396_1 /TAXON_ID=73915 /ORGANISM="Pyrodinium bahamense, Strain pbaha01" /LENGTH=240 /DNA_ID=CAMNT_0020798281 /DNA_START=73 /DNA_END=795 /DNA_ORIENTATION=+